MAEKPYPSFQEAGLKVIFYLLQNIANVNKPYREIQRATGVSLGAIKNIINVLAERNFILIANRRRTLKNINKLIDYENKKTALYKKCYFMLLVLRLFRYIFQ